MGEREEPAGGPHTASKTSASAEEARRAAQVAADKAKGALDEQKRKMADQVSGIASALRAGARELSDEQRPVAAYAEEGAERLAHLAGRIRERDVDHLADDLGDLARRNPLAFFAGSVAIGFFLSRFLKSSGEGVAEAREVTHEVATRPTEAPAAPVPPH